MGGCNTLGSSGVCKGKQHLLPVVAEGSELFHVTAVDLIQGVSP